MASKPLITLLLPFFNEEGFIGRTVESLAQQGERRFHLLLIDNGSTDCGRQEALAAAAAIHDVETKLVYEATAGKIFALKAGLARTTTPFVATIDADTIYPPHYVETCLRLFERHQASSCVLATGLMGNPSSFANTLRRLRTAAYACIFRNRAHSGGFGQAFSTSALRAVGGFDAAIWPYVLEDHEVVHRLAGQGPIVHSFSHYCSPSDRRTDRRHVSWNRAERIAYKLMPQRLMGWYFYHFLASRFAAHGKQSSALRSRNWHAGEA